MILTSAGKYVIEALSVGVASSGVLGWYWGLDERTRSCWSAMVEALRTGLRGPSTCAAGVYMAMLTLKQAIRVAKDGDRVYEWEPLTVYRERVNQV